MKIVVALIVALFLSVVASAQTVAQLAGVWRLDPTRSEIKLSPAVSEMTLTIEQSETEVVISRDVLRDSGPVHVAKLTYRIGEVSSNTIYGRPETGTAVWSGKGRLVITGERVGGNGVPHRFQLIIGLSDDGKELLLEDEDYLGSTTSSNRQWFTRQGR